ncbi:MULTISPECIES: efflux RND transporter permease subunit [Thermomonas]|uniref:Efflux RND transporter permease subunit n=3 Tax=Lysobacteraceae TaxID=32033 RepID=A0ABS7TE80_9GAMM|nr:MULTISPECIES: efflux RND transporter permease subunit [Thermomonas]MBS0459586.1 efflux RND transporter permease subunit [Pseudomonadota bacterium]MDE2381358.1 efflux RND transporter permease subunit [Xanthomonadaceae bacterium]MBZ4186171.1 efflux RND transporter permease subunit [Thermomonas beijingensis]HOC10055.1 efflux RND transporter permease subunit [Thermomonas sp.]HQA00875.1 efflux RND transporter permease subunit [Thermomonas sp.]
MSPSDDLHDPLHPPGGGFSLVEFATRRRVTVAMMTLTLVLFGLIALGSLKVNLLPDLSYPTLTVRTDYPGAAPSEVETLISQPAEEALGVVKGLRKLKSVSRTGQSDVVLEFAWGTNMDQASLDVRDKMEALQFPLDAKAPVLLRFNPSTQPIMRLALSPKQASSSADEIRQLMELRRYADEDLKRKLEPVAGVAAVKVGGGLEDEVQVDVDQRKLAQLGLTIDNVIQRLQQENVNVSGGRLEEGAQRYLVRTVNQFANVDEIRNMLLTTRAAASSNSGTQQAMRVAAASGNASVMAALSQGGSNNAAGVQAIRLKDVAEVRQGYKEREAIIRLNGRETVELALYKEGDANTVATADALEAKLKEIREKLPRGVELTTIEDQSIFIRNAIHSVKFDGVLGGILSILIIFLFLRDGWSTFVISLSLPVSIIATFFIMGQLGLSLNVMSLGGLALATGLVVDDSIVVLESIAKARERGLGILEATIAGTREVSMAVVASTLTTIAVFLPLVFVQGIAGQLFRDQALTVAIAIAVSLVVAMTLIPMLSSLKGRAPMGFPDEPAHPRWQAQKTWQKPVMYGGRGVGALFRYGFFGVAWLIVRIWRGIAAVVGPVMRKASDVAMAPYARAERGYLRILPAALSRPVPILLVAGVAFALTLAVVPLLGTDLIPQLAQDRFEMTAKLPPGTPLAQTDALVRQVQAAHGKDPGARVLYGVSGTGTRLDASPTESGENIGKLTVVMDGNQHEGPLTEGLRKTMREHPGVQVDFSRPELFSLSPPLEIEVEGQDLDAIRDAGNKLARMLRANGHYADVKSTVEQGFPEIQIRFDQDRAAALGLTTRQIADAVVNKVKGNVATRYSFRDRKIDVLVRAEASDRASVDDIRHLIVNSNKGAPVELAAVATVTATTGPSEIHRADHKRVAIVSANLHGIDLGNAIREVDAMVAATPLGVEIGMRIGGQGQELDESIRSLLFAFALAVFLVYLVMASQFESLLHPFVILFTIPLAMVGAVAALLLTRSVISVVVFIGLILLVGLVVKNAIILIDKVNQLREDGVAKREALVEGARSRLRPIMMTTLCAVFGFLPLALAFGDGAEVRSPMAVTVIGGLLVSTLLTLVVIPVVYDLLDRKPDEFYAERGRRARKDAEAVASVLSHEHDPLNGGAKG